MMIPYFISQGEKEHTPEAKYASGKYKHRQVCPASAYLASFHCAGKNAIQTEMNT